MSMSGSNCTTGDVTWTVSTTTGKGTPSITFGNQNGQSCIKFGAGKNNYYSKMTLTTSAFSSYNVSSVVIYASSNNGGSKTFKVTQGAIQIGTGSQTFSSTTWVTNITRNTTSGSGGDLSIEISSNATATYIHSIKVTYSAASCTVKPTVGDALTSVSATVNSITATVPISAIGGCNITENGLVYSTSVATPTVGAANCTKVTTTACGSTAANKTVEITGLTCGQSYYVRGYATNAAGTSYTNVTTQSTSACPLYTITYNAGSGTCATSTWTQGSVGASTTLPTAAPSCDGWSFAGWCTSSAGDEDDNTTSPGTILTGEYTPTDNVDLYAVYTKTEGGGGTSDVTDEITAADLAATSTTYTNFSSVSGSNSDAVYAGQSAKNGSDIQLRGTSPAGIVSTTSGGKIKSVVITWSSESTASRTINVYGKTTAYSTAADLYNASTDGDNVGSITYTSSSNYQTTYNFSSDYDYVGIRMNSSATRIASVSFTWTTSGGGTTYYMTDYECAATPTITVSTTEIEFGDKKVGGTYTETFTVSGENLTGAINLAVSGAQAGKYSVSPTTLSPTAGTVAETTITVTFAPTASSDHAAQVDITSDGATAKTVSLHAISKWEVTWKNDGTVYKTTLVQGGHKPTFPATPTSCDTEESNVFYGWTDAEWPGKIDNVSAKTIHKSNATMPNASNNTTIYYAVFVKRTGSVDDYTDNLTRTTTTRPSTTTYGDWSGISASNTGHSSAVYTGNSAGANDAIQLRSSNSSGIITTTSGGKAKKVTVVWESHTTSGRTVDVYGKNAAYSTTSDLYGTNEQKGTKIGSIVEGTSTELTIDDDYAYIGIRSNDGALYLTSISIDWQDGEYSYSKYMTNCCDYYITVGTPTTSGTGTGTVAFASGGSAVAAGSDVATCAGTTTITATVTPNPGHQCDALSFTGGSVSVSPAIPDPFVPFDNAGATTYTLTFAKNTNATLATAVTFTQLHDYYIDYMHDNAKVTKNGNYGTAPSLSSTTPGDGCAGSHYKFVGWVPESDMNMETGVPNTTTHMVTGGQTDMYATGTNYYAIWAEEVTP